jgi:hypothetical protein
VSEPDFVGAGRAGAAADPQQQVIRVRELSPGDRLVIRTDHTVYHLAVIEPDTRQVVLWGGPFFPNPVGVHLDGCSRDGRFMEIGAICIGCSLEFRTGTGTVVTGVVRSIGVVHRG